MNKLVKIYRDDDGTEIEDPVWHLVDPTIMQAETTLCTGECFGEGESAVVFEVKAAERGGITCKACLDKLRAYKSIRL